MFDGTETAALRTWLDRAYFSTSGNLFTDENAWTAQNLAVAGSYNWKGNSTEIDAYFRIVGRNYYSAGVMLFEYNSTKRLKSLVLYIAFGFG